MKEKRFSRLLSLMLAAFLLFQNMGMVAYGAENTDVEANKSANVEQTFEVGHVGDAQNFEIGGGSETLDGSASALPEGVVLSYKDAPYVDTSFVDENKAAGTNPVKANLPASYSSSSYVPAATSSNYMSFVEKRDVVTPTKNQGNYGTCWSHAAMSVAESSYIINYGLTSNSVNFNEYQHVWYAYHPVQDKLGLYGGDNTVNPSSTNDLDLGGNNLISMMMLSNWVGPSNAGEDVFDASDVLYENTPAASFAHDDIAHLENAYVLTIPNADYYDSYADMKVDMDIVKQAIKDYGSVTVSYYANPGTAWYYGGFQCIDIYDALNTYGTNHAVTIVGWNDNIPASAFPSGAEGNGAWLVKNSWGTSMDFGGYFWLSYYDKTIGMNAIAMDFGSADNYDNNYHYDGAYDYTGYVYYSGYDYVYGGNAFVADSAETLKAVGLTTYDVGYDYTIYVYTDVPAGGAPTDGTLAATQSGNLTYAGVHTVELNEAVFLDAGERYGIVVYYEKAGWQVALSADMTSSWGWVDFYGYAKEGESYIGLSLDGMVDMNEGYYSYTDEGYNVRIKAFTDEGHNAGDIFDKVPYGVQQAADGNWYFFRNGAIDWTYNGLARNDYGIWVITNGALNWGYNGLYQFGDNWVYVENGGVNRAYTGLVNFNGIWFYVEYGVLNWDYVGLVQFNGAWFYVEGGQLNWNYTGLTCYNGTWFYVENGALNWNYTGLVNHYGTWFYVEGGVLNWGYTGLTLYNGIWFYVEGGQLNWNYTGLVMYNGIWFYVEGGQLNWNYTGLTCYNGVWFYVEGGQLNWNYTGLVQHFDAWFYVEGGVLNWDYTGLCQYNGVWFYIQNGQLNWGYTGTVYWNGIWWYVENGILVGQA